MTSLAEILRGWDVRPGVTYRTKINGQTLEFRVVDTVTSSDLAEQVMMAPWVELPFLPLGTVTAQPGPVPLRLGQ